MKFEEIIDWQRSCIGTLKLKVQTKLQMRKSLPWTDLLIFFILGNHYVLEFI